MHSRTGPPNGNSWPAASPQCSAGSRRTLMTELPITVLRRCRWAWRRIGVPSAAITELAAELEADLEAAWRDGRQPIDYVGGDPAGFARAWAAARDLVPQRLYLVRLALATVLGAIPGCLAGLF